MTTYLMLGAGLVLLFVGGDGLVRGAATLAARLGVPAMVIGLTVVGFGTSTPELLVSLQAAWAGQPGIAIGNVIGSNIANILLIGGCAALIAPMVTPLAAIRRDLIVMLAATLTLPVVLWSGSIGPVEGGFLAAGLVAYLVMTLRGSGAAETDDLPPTWPVWLSVVALVAGLGALMLGANLLVNSASTIARAFGVSEAMIGLSIVAVGTSLPELATSVIAALRGQRDIAIGNIIGSNIFNILFILGLTALIAPIPVAERFLTVDAPVALVVALGLCALVVWRGQIGRGAAALMLVGYAGYLGLTAGL